MASNKYEARIKPSDQNRIVVAFGGAEFVKYEWRPVPSDEKSEAQAAKYIKNSGHPYLEIRQVAGKKPAEKDEGKSK